MSATRSRLSKTRGILGVSMIKVIMAIPVAVFVLLQSALLRYEDAIMNPVAPTNRTVEFNRKPHAFVAEVASQAMSRNTETISLPNIETSGNTTDDNDASSIKDESKKQLQNNDSFHFRGRETDLGGAITMKAERNLPFDEAEKIPGASSKGSSETKQLEVEDQEFPVESNFQSRENGELLSRGLHNENVARDEQEETKSRVQDLLDVSKLTSNSHETEAVHDIDESGIRTELESLVEFASKGEQVLSGQINDQNMSHGILEEVQRFHFIPDVTSEENITLSLNAVLEAEESLQEIEEEVAEIVKQQVKVGRERENQENLGLTLNETSSGNATGNLWEEQWGTSESKDNVKILYYSAFFGDPNFMFGKGKEGFLRSNCPVTACSTTPYIDVLNATYRQLGQYDAVIFSFIDFDMKMKFPELQKIQSWRQPHQRFVMYGYESQAWKVRDPSNFDNFFNWSMSFRWDSDIVLPYGWFTPKLMPSSNSTYHNMVPVPPPKQWKEFDEHDFANRALPEVLSDLEPLAQRPKKVAWIVSNCRMSASMRHEYVQELRKHIQVDVFGGAQADRKACHTNMTMCNMMLRDGKDNCTLAVEEDYKFYLAFENTLCNDYLSEKMYMRMDKNVVVTLSQANITYLAPPHSSISVLDYPSPKALAEYLHYLDKNDTAYLSYFWWKEHYDVHPQLTGDSGFCSLCEKLVKEKKVKNAAIESNNSSAVELKLKVYENFTSWWVQPAHCHAKKSTVKSMIPADSLKRPRFSTVGAGHVRNITRRQGASRAQIHALNARTVAARQKNIDIGRELARKAKVVKWAQNDVRRENRRGDTKAKTNFDHQPEVFDVLLNGPKAGSKSVVTRVAPNRPRENSVRKKWR